jgi:hypothetical protein
MATELPHCSVHNLHHNAPPTAEMALGLLLAAAKRILPADRWVVCGMSVCAVCICMSGSMGGISMCYCAVCLVLMIDMLMVVSYMLPHVTTHTQHPQAAARERLEGRRGPLPDHHARCAND